MSVVPAKQTAHVEDGLSKLTGAWYGKPRVRAWLASYLRPIQRLEDAFYDLLLIRILDNAIGYYLDVLGAIIDEPRAGKNDARYRLAIRVKARVNRSNGKVKDIWEILALAATTWRYREVYPAGFRVDFGPFDGPEIARWLNRAKAAGVATEVVYRDPAVPVRGFRWASTTPGQVVDAGRWGDVAQTVGDPLAAVIRTGT